MLPIDLIYPTIDVELDLTSDIYAERLKDVFLQAYESCRQNRDLVIQRSTLLYNRAVRPKQYKVKDLVRLRNDTTKKGIKKKYKQRQRGPYKVICKLNDLHYGIRSVEKKKGKLLITHVDRLKKCFFRSINKAT